MTLVTEEEAKSYTQKAKNWLYNHHRSYIFGDVKGIVHLNFLLAVAEYIANQDDKTLYPINKHLTPTE